MWKESTSEFVFLSSFYWFSSFYFSYTVQTFNPYPAKNSWAILESQLNNDKYLSSVRQVCQMRLFKTAWA